MNVARTTYRAALVAAAISCLGYVSVAYADRGDWRGDGGGHGRWSEQRGPARDHRDDRRYGGRDERHWGDRGGYRGWAPPPPRYWRPPSYYYAPPRYYAPPPRYYRPYPRTDGYPRAYGGWRGAGYGYRSGDWCDDDRVSLTIRIPF